MTKLVALLALAGLLLAQTGCQHVRPWERGKLAHPSMTEPLSGSAEAHVRDVHEGAVGGGAAAESGCGCN